MNGSSLQMSQILTNLLAARWIGVFLLTTASGCFYIPTWRIPNFEPCQSAENAWGCLVDTVEHQSPIDQPWCDPHYHPQGVYRVAIPGQWHPNHSTYSAPQEVPTKAEHGDLKPPIEAPPPQLNVPE